MKSSENKFERMYKVKEACLLAGFFLLASIPSFAQEDDLMKMLEAEDDTRKTEYAKASFKTTRVINAHSLENVGGGVLDMKISHRFGFISGGAYELFGLDQAFIRIGLDYGINDRIMVGFGRGNFEKTFDGFAKFKLLRQSKGDRVMPVTLSYLATSSLTSLKFQDTTRINFFSSRMAYTHQIILGRKFSEGFTLQVMPTVVHRNLVKNRGEKNDVFAIGTAGRIKLTKRLAVNAEHFYLLPDQTDPKYTNSLSLGLDIETGGHVFQLHFTNSTSMIERGFITETVGKWSKADVHFGFNVSRVFTVKRKKAPME